MPFAEPTRAAVARGASVLALAGSLGLLFAGPLAVERLWEWSGQGPVCTFRAATGQACVGCGGTRALRAAARGRFVEALRSNLLGAACGLVLWTLAAGAAAALSLGTDRPLRVSLWVATGLVPLAFLWSLVSWWASLPPGFAFPR